MKFFSVFVVLSLLAFINALPVKREGEETAQRPEELFKNATDGNVPEPQNNSEVSQEFLVPNNKRDAEEQTTEVAEEAEEQVNIEKRDEFDSEKENNNEEENQPESQNNGEVFQDFLGPNDKREDEMVDEEQVAEVAEEKVNVEKKCDEGKN
jgi:hypothetical protein